MAGKMIVDRRSDARLLAGTARELSVDAAPDLAQRLAPLLRPGETLPDFAFVFELVARDLEEASASLTSKGKGFKDELEAALTELSRGHGKEGSRVAGKQLSIKGFDRLHQCSARLFQDLLKYAGRSELTARVRLAYHKPGSGGAEPPAPAPGDGTQGTPQAPPPGSSASS